MSNTLKLFILIPLTLGTFLINIDNNIFTVMGVHTQNHVMILSCIFTLIISFSIFKFNIGLVAGCLFISVLMNVYSENPAMLSQQFWFAVMLTIIILPYVRNWLEI